MLRGAVEFYRNHPNVKKGADGKYHIHWANSNESVYGARDTDEDMSAMRGVTGALLRAAEILDTEPAMRPVWREFLDNLAPLPLSDNPEALKPENYAGPRVFVRGLKPAVKPSGGLLPDGNSLPMWFFDLCNVESRDRAHAGNRKRDVQRRVSQWDRGRKRRARCSPSRQSRRPRWGARTRCDT